jgi:asparagine synthase (glutamine-hydrolysing)
LDERQVKARRPQSIFNMCGIVGIWSNRHNEAIRSELDEAVRRLNHRGPDDRGLWYNDAGVALGFARLSIVDLSPSGHQPMKSADGRYVIVFNGEIYNYAEIRAKLEAKGRQFVSRSDTEVILHAYDEWGAAAVERFIGMFAIAIWDSREQTLELLRDRVGVKPLYFGWHDGTLCFASELKALRAFGHWTPAINRQSLGEFLQYGYISENRSIYTGVHKLLPGHRLRLTRGRQLHIERYWSILETAQEPLNQSDQGIEAELEALLISAARYRMVADVPVGVYLSGGIDSSLVTALLAKHHDRPIRTFTIGFREDSHDESGWARKIAQHCGTIHQEYILEAPEAAGIAKRWGALFDEPFGDSSAIPTLLVSQLARKEVKVVLSADGGDELFSGYNVYTAVLKRFLRLQRMPASLRSLSSAMLPLASSLGVLGGNAFARSRKLERLQSMLKQPTIGRVFELDKELWSSQEIDQLIGGYESPRLSADVFPGTDADKISYWDFQHYLPEDILTKVDRMTMAASIEGREPLLDHRVAEYAFRLPGHLKRGALGPKHILKSILYRYVPRELLERRKHGFGIPLDHWLRDELKDLIMDQLAENRIRSSGLLDSNMVNQLRSEFYAGAQRLKSPLWFVFAFEMWRQTWL